MRCGIAIKNGTMWQCQTEKSDTGRQALPMRSAMPREPLLYSHFGMRGFLFVFLGLLCLFVGVVWFGIVLLLSEVFLCSQRRTHFYKGLPEKHNIPSNVALMGFL